MQEPITTKFICEIQNYLNLNHSGRWRCISRINPKMGISFWTLRPIMLVLLWSGSRIRQVCYWLAIYNVPSCCLPFFSESKAIESNSLFLSLSIYIYSDLLNVWETRTMSVLLAILLRYSSFCLSKYLIEWFNVRNGGIIWLSTEWSPSIVSVMFSFRIGC